MKEKVWQIWLRDFVTALVLALLLLGAGGIVIFGSLENSFQFMRAWYFVRQRYVHTPNTETLTEGAIAGMIASLKDPYSYYLPPKEMKKLNDVIEGTHVGIGIILMPGENGPKITQVLPGGSAAKAGVQSGDTLLAVNGESVKDLALPQVVQKISGPEGTNVTLLLQGAAGEKTWTLARQKFVVPSTEHRMLTADVGYLQIRQFTEETPEEVHKSIQDLRFNGMRKLVLDLRGNPGGSLTAVEKVAGYLLPEGDLVRIVPRSENASTIRNQGAEHVVPMAVLTDFGTASAAEILSGAIQDRKLGKIIGLTTHGKGTVQGIFSLGDQAGVRLTIAEYFSPSGRRINGKGVIPDIPLSDEETHSYYAVEKGIAELQ